MKSVLSSGPVQFMTAFCFVGLWFGFVNMMWG
jgi:hypothetical protein